MSRTRPVLDLNCFFFFFIFSAQSGLISGYTAYMLYVQPITINFYSPASASPMWGLKAGTTTPDLELRFESGVLCI